jgi:hypothetical protein
MRDTLSSIVRAIANGEVRRFLEDQEADSQVNSCRKPQCAGAGGGPTAPVPLCELQPELALYYVV